MQVRLRPARSTPSFAGGRPYPCRRDTGFMRTMQDTGNPNAAQQAFQIKNKMAAMPFVAVPEFLRRAAGRAPIRVMVLGALGSQGLAAPDALGAGCCPACAACRVSFQPRLQPNLQRIAQTAAARPASRWNSTKGAIRRWRPRRVCRFCARRSESSTVIVCNRQRSSTAPLGQGPRRMRDPLPKDRRVACRHAGKWNPTRGTDASAFTPAKSLCRIHCRKGT